MTLSSVQRHRPGILGIVLVGGLILLGGLHYRKDLEAEQRYQAQQQQFQQQLSDLNDRLAVLARQQREGPDMGKITEPATREASRQHEWLLQSLMLAQQALDQQRPAIAREVLTSLLATWAQSQWVPAQQDSGLLATVHAQIEQEQRILSQRIGTEQAALHAIDRALDVLQQQLAQIALQPPRLPMSSQHALLGGLVQLDVADRNSEARMAMRPFNANNVRLTLGLARRALAAGDRVGYQDMLQQAHQELGLLVSAEFRPIQRAVGQLLNHPLPPPLALTSLTTLRAVSAAEPAQP